MFEYLTMVFFFVFVDVASAILSYFIVDQIAERTVNNVTTRVLWWICVFIVGVFLMTVLGDFVVELMSGKRVLFFPREAFWVISFVWFGSWLTPFFVVTLVFGVFVEIFKADSSELQKRG